MAPAATNTKGKQQQPPPAAATHVQDPKFEWTEKAGSYVLRLALPDFRKDDFRVQVDGAGRLTVRGSRPAPTGPGSLHKVFQLPATANLDDITGRFEAGVLTLTVPKRASSAGGDAGAAPTSIEEIKRKQPGVAKDEGGVKKGDAGAKKAEAKEDASKKSMDKAQEKKQEEVEGATSRKQEQQKPAPSPAPVKKEEEVKPKAPQAAAPKPEAATSGDKAKAAVAPESLAERVRRRGEEERARAAAAATAAMKAVSEPEKKATASWGGGWKERVQGELKVLTDMKWADGMVEAARNNKEVIAVGVAAFSLGFLVSQKLLRK